MRKATNVTICSKEQMNILKRLHWKEVISGSAGQDVLWLSSLRTTGTIAKKNWKEQKTANIYHINS